MDNKPGDTSGDEGVGHRDRGGFWPTCEMVHAGEDVAMTYRGLERRRVREVVKVTDSQVAVSL